MPSDLSPLPPSSPPGLDVIVLAGGTGRRLGGASKPDVVARGARLLDHVLGGVMALRDGGLLGSGRTVVVAPPQVAVPDGVLRTLEDPPLGGPVAGIAAGLTVLRAPSRTPPLSGLMADPPGTRTVHRAQARPVAPTAVLTCDAPEGPSALPTLVAALSVSPGAEGACASTEGFVQHLLGVYRTASLSAAVAPGGRALRDVSVKRTLGMLRLAEVDTVGVRKAAADLDTWPQVRAWDIGAGRQPAPGLSPGPERARSQWSPPPSCSRT